MANRYWVGGTNAWDSTTTAYWSTTPGGSGGASVPTSADDVYFDAGTTLTATGTVVCRSLTVDAGASAGYSGYPNPVIQVYGSLYFGPSSTSLTFDMQFLSTSTGNTVYLGSGSAFGFGSVVTFNGAGGSWTQTSDAIYSDVVLTQGTYSTDGYLFSVSGFSSSNTNTRTLALGTSTVYVDASWNVSTSTNFTVTYAFPAAILAKGSFYGGGKSWPSLTNGVNYGTLFVYGSNTFYALNAGSSFAYPGTLALESGTTTTVLNGITLTGSSSSLLYLQATSSGAATISKASGTVNASYTSIENSTATGGARFSALLSYGNVDAGNNTGWLFSSGAGNFFSFF